MKPLFRRGELDLNHTRVGQLVTRLQNSPNYYYVLLGASLVKRPDSSLIFENMVNLDYLRFAVGGAKKLRDTKPVVTSGSYVWLRSLRPLSDESKVAWEMARLAVIEAYTRKLYNEPILWMARENINNVLNYWSDNVPRPRTI